MLREHVPLHVRRRYDDTRRAIRANYAPLIEAANDEDRGELIEERDAELAACEPMLDVYVK